LLNAPQIDVNPAPDTLMRYLPILLLASLAAACGDAGRDPAPPAADDSAAAVEEEPTSGFVVLRGTDTVLVERFTHTERALEGELMEPGEGDRLHYRATIGAQGRVTSLDLQVVEEGESVPRQRLILNIVGDSLLAEQHEGASMQRRTVAVPPRTGPYLGISVAMLEQLVRQALALGGDPVELSVLSISGDGETELVTPTVTRIGADSVRVRVDASSELRLAVDAEGRITGGENVPQGLRVERTGPR
jgi:hypothetical protein